MNIAIPKHAGSPSLLNWYTEGLRSAFFIQPRWKRLHASPAAVALLAVSAVLLSVVLQRMYVNGYASFYWRAIGSGWLSTALLAWACYLVRPDTAYDPNPRVAPSAAHLLCAILSQMHVIALASTVLTIGLLRGGLYNEQTLGSVGIWVVSLLSIGWMMLAEIAVLVRSGARRLVPRLIAVPVLLLSSLLYLALPPASFWRSAAPDYEQAADRDLVLTQELMEAQPALLAQRLDEISPQRSGVIDMYAITFAPYADEDVFRRESEMVSEVVTQRFDAAGRNIQLVNHVDSTEEWPWATPMNLKRTILHMAETMDRDEDILFLHLTSHGARDGQLAAEFWPMTVDNVTPENLKTWLDEAGIRHRVISISACYSGSWIAPLDDDDSLIMTAADADHTSYGCGRGSELTFFGRAVFDEQLRNQTHSFEQAHATARVTIKQREEEAGKSDGYSNPQIKVGEAIRLRLDQLQNRIEVAQ